MVMYLIGLVPVPVVLEGLHPDKASYLACLQLAKSMAFSGQISATRFVNGMVWVSGARFLCQVSFICSVVFHARLVGFPDRVYVPGFVFGAIHVFGAGLCSGKQNLAQKPKPPQKLTEHKRIKI